MSLSPDAIDLDAAMEAYIATFPSQDRLRHHLAAIDRADAFEHVHRALQAAVQTAEKLLHAEKNGVDWSPEWETRFRAHLKSRHAWLRDAGVARLLSYARWLCWHEGLNAPGSE